MWNQLYDCPVCKQKSAKNNKIPHQCEYHPQRLVLKFRSKSRVVAKNKRMEGNESSEFDTHRHQPVHHTYVTGGCDPLLLCGTQLPWSHTKHALITVSVAFLNIRSLVTLRCYSNTWVGASRLPLPAKQSSGANLFYTASLFANLFLNGAVP